MVELANSTRRFTANACLHQQISSSKRFLRRNLRQILDSHERRAKPEPEDASREDMIANERRAAGWDYPTKEMLDDLTRGDKPVLQLAGLHLRHPKSKTKKRKRGGSDGRDEYSDWLYSDWLPDPQVQAKWPCQVSIAVREKETSKRSIYAETRHATISQYQQTSSEHSHFEVALAEPFLIEVSKLFVAVESGSNGYRHWRRTVTAKYSLEVSIQCRDSDDTANFLSVLEDEPRAKYGHIPGSEGILRAAWDEMPKCPGSGQLLTLKRTKGHAAVSPQYKLELSMGWSRKQESPLQRYNRAFLETSRQDRQLLTPSFEGAEKTARHVIAYKFCEGLNTRVKRVEGLRCPLCRERPKTFPRLLLHCSTFHDHFRVDVEESREGSLSDPSVISKTILLSVSAQHYDKVTEQGKDEPCNWIAPDRPFDTEVYLKGDNSWTGYNTKTKTSKKRGRQAGVHFKDAQPLTAPRPVVKRPAPEQVPNLPLNGHRKYRVPDVPGVRFYHSVSKKAIEPGEMISDSDESVDEFWTVDIQRQALKELNINGAAQDFTIAFNRHLAREQSTSSLLMKEAVVRFTRGHRKELQDVGWQRPFRKKLEQLQNAGVINRLTVTHCIQLMQAEKAGEDAEMVNGVHETSTAKGKAREERQLHGVLKDATNAVRRLDQVNGDPARTPSLEPSRQNTPLTNGERRSKGRVRWGTGGSINRDSAQHSPSVNRETPNGISPTVNGKPNGMHMSGEMDIDAEPKVNGFHKAMGKELVNGIDTAPQKQKQVGLCTCGKPAKDIRAAVICSNPKCARKDFHLACVGLERRQIGWKCADCTTTVA